MKQIRMWCDRCKKEFDDNDYQFNELLGDKYNCDICESCDTLIELAKTLTESDLINNVPPGTALKEMCKNYGIQDRESQGLEPWS